MKIETGFRRADQLAAASAIAQKYQPLGARILMVLVPLAFIVLGVVIAFLLSFVLIAVLAWTGSDTEFLISLITMWAVPVGLLAGWVLLITIWPRFCFAITARLMTLPDRDGAPVSTTLQEDRLAWSGPEGTGSVPWASIDWVLTQPRVIAFGFGLSVHFVSRQAFADEAEQAAFLEAVSARITPEARRRSRL